MKLSADNKVEKISCYLLQLCYENGIFPPEIEHCNPTDDLIEGGLVDSMGLVYMQGIIQEKFALELELEMFIAELRTIQSMAAYLTEQLSDQWFEKNNACLLKAAALTHTGKIP